MFYIIKKNNQISSKVPELMKKHTVFEIKSRDLGVYILYYENRDHYKFIERKDEIVFYNDGSLYSFSEYELKSNGLFFIVKISLQHDYIEIISDKINSHPIYFTKDFDVFTSHLLLLNTGNITIDPEVLNNFLLLSYNPFFGKTINKDVKQTIPGSIHKIKNRCLVECKKQNSIFDYLPSKEVYGDEEFYNKLDEIYKNSFSSIIKDTKRMHVQLSGGVDSRGSLSEVHRQFSGEIITHGYGPSNFVDNIIANKVVQSMDRICHKMYEFNNGDDILKYLDSVIFHSSLDSRFDDVFRSYVISKNMDCLEEPIISSLSIDCLLGDRTYLWMSKSKFFSKINKDKLINFLSYFHYIVAPSMFKKEELNEITDRLYNHLQDYLPEDISEIDAFDSINLMMRHAKGTYGNMRGTLPFRRMLIPPFNNDVWDFTFKMKKKHKYKMIGYLTYLSKYVFYDSIKDIPIATRMAIPINELIKVLNIEYGSKTRDYLARIIKKLHSYRQKLIFKKKDSFMQSAREDYFITFYRNNKKLREFIIDNVNQFDNRKLIDRQYSKIIDVPEAERILLSLSMINHCLHTNRK